VSQFKPEDIRNVVVIGHEGSGKTMLTEAFLRSMGEIIRMGSIEDGSTVCDHNQEEIDRTKSISLALCQGQHKGKKINLLDTPGFAEFSGEVLTGVRVADSAVVTVSAQNGVEVGTELFWEQARQRDLSGLFVINHLDKEQANFDSTLDELKQVFGSAILPLQIPVNAGSENFDTVIDLGLMKQLKFTTDGSGDYTEEELSGDARSQADEMLEAMTETVAESDDELLEKFFEAGELTPDEFKAGLEKGIATGKIYPVLCSVASRNRGPRRILDMLADYFPAPSDRPGEVVKSGDSEKEISCAPDGELSAMVFKTVVEKHVGELSFFRVFSGKATTGAEVKNVSQKGDTTKFGQLFYPAGKNRKDTDAVIAGDIGVTVKMKSCRTGDSLIPKSGNYTFAPVNFPETVHDEAIKAVTEGDEEKISTGLQALMAEDPSFQVIHSAELNQIIIAGQGEMQLQILVEKLKTRYGVEARLSEPGVPFRETITARADEKYRHKKQSGGAGQFAEVWMRIEPMERGGDFEFASEVVGGNISQPFIPAIEKGIKQVMNQGIVSGHKVVDVKAIVYDGKEHPVDSKDIAFQIAGREVFKMAVKKAKPILLEPIYDIRVKVPEDYMGDVMGDISSRRGKIQGMEAEGRYQVINAKVPLADLYRYCTHLRSMTQGRGIFSRTFSHYEKMPEEEAKKVVAAYESSQVE